MAGNRWIFTKDQLVNTPSQRNGIDTNTELSYRQLTASLIQDMGQKLAVTQLCINTAIVYMHRFYMVQSFRRFPHQEMATACIFLAAKVEEQARKLEHVIRAANSCLHREALDVKNDAYIEQAHTLVINEDILLQTLGFEVRVDHAHSLVVKTCQLIQASKDLAQTSYFLATNCLHLTTFCLQYKPTVLACICILLACKWSNWEIPKSSEGQEWYHYVDKSITLEMLEEYVQEFLNILEKCPSKLKKKLMGQKAGGRVHTVKNEELPPKKRQRLENTPIAATTTDSTSDGNMSLPMPSGHEQKVDTRQQANCSTFSPSSGTVSKAQQYPYPQEPILHIHKSCHIERPLSDSGSLQIAGPLAAKLQTKRTKPDSMSVKAYLEWKEKECKQSLKHEHIQPHENRHEHLRSVPNIPTKQEPVTNTNNKLESSSNVNTLESLSNVHNFIQDPVPHVHIKEEAVPKIIIRQKCDENYNQSALDRSYSNTAVERHARKSNSEKGGPQNSRPESQSLKARIRLEKTEEIPSVKMKVKISTPPLKEEHKHSGDKKYSDNHHHHSSKSQLRDLHHHSFHSSHITFADSPACGTNGNLKLHIKMSDGQNQIYQNSSSNDLGAQSSNMMQSHRHELSHGGKHGWNREMTDTMFNRGIHDSHYQDSKWHSHPWIVSNLMSQSTSEISHSPAHGTHTNSLSFSIPPGQQHLSQVGQVHGQLKQLIELKRLHIANQMSQQSNVGTGFDLDAYCNSCSPPPLPAEPPPRPPSPPSPFSSSSLFDESAI